MDAPYFEAHITIPARDRERAEKLSSELGFHLSSIIDDEMMGPGINAYATKSSTDFERLRSEVFTLMQSFKLEFIIVRRYKIEMAIVDVRYN